MGFTPLKVIFPLKDELNCVIISKMKFGKFAKELLERSSNICFTSQSSYL